jgi:ABC-type branched-subunit amino acid transport system substrate-binding protein
MAAKEIHAGGGIKVGGDSYMLNVIAYDDKANPTEASNAVRKLIDRDGVKFILGFCCSGATGAVASENGIAYHANYSAEYGIAPSPSSPYAYDQTYALKDAIEAAGTVEDTAAVASALRELAVPDEVVMQYLPVDGKMFDPNGQAYTSNGAFQWQSGNWVFVQDLPSDAAAYSAFLSTID